MFRFQGSISSLNHILYELSWFQRNYSKPENKMPYIWASILQTVCYLSFFRFVEWVQVWQFRPDATRFLLCKFEQNKLAQIRHIENACPKISIWWSAFSIYGSQLTKSDLISNLRKLILILRMAGMSICI